MTVSKNNHNRTRFQPFARLAALLHPYDTGRIRLFFVNIAIKLSAMCISGLGIYLHSPGLSLLGIFIWLFWFALMSGVAIPGTDNFLRHRLRWLKPVSVFITLAILGVGVAWVITTATLNSEYEGNIVDHYSPNTAGLLAGAFSYNDATALCQQAGENLIQGRDPYAWSNVVTASIEHNVSGTWITPLRKGTFASTFPYPDLNELTSFWEQAEKHPSVIPVELESKYSYPAGSFLLLAPFLLAGIQDIRIVFALFFLGSLAIIIRMARRERRIVLILAIMVSLELFTIVAMGDTGILQFPFLLFGWVLWKKHWRTSALLMGIAITIKQVSWIYMLFYLVLVFRVMGSKRLASVIGISGGVFLATNLPFFIDNPSLWTSSMLAIVTDPTFPSGVGIISLVTNGLIIIKNSLVFNLSAMAVLIAGLVYYYRHCRAYPYLGPVLAIIPFFFTWRSLWGYLFFADFIVLACILFYEYSPGLAPVLQVRQGNQGR